MHRRRLLAIPLHGVALLTILGSPAVADSKPTAGRTVRSFYVRAVTGPLRNKSVCYVCRYGRRPVAMVLVRKFDDRLKPLFVELDRLLDRNRKSGLKGFGVFLAEEPFKSVGRVQTFAFENKLTMPLCVGSTAIANAGLQTTTADAGVVVVLYHRQQVVRTFRFRPDSIAKADVRRVLAAVRRLAAVE